MWLTIAIFSAIIFGLGSVIMKTATLQKCSDHYILLGLYISGTLFFLATTGGQIPTHTNYLFWVWSFLIACGSYFGNWAVIKALELGPASLTAPMLNLNLPLFIMMSIFMYGEHLDWIKALIIAAILFSLVLVKYDPNENLVIRNKKWFLFVFIGSLFLFLREGGLKITLEQGFNNKEILLVSYIICLALSVTNILPLKQKNNEQTNVIEQYKTKSLIFGLCTGMCSGLGLFLYSKALETGPASIVILIFSARIFVIIFFSYVWHKERLSLFQKFSLAAITVGISLASLIK